MNFLYKYILCVILIAQSLFSCQEKVLGPMESDGVAPGKVTITNVENIPGGAILKFDLPADEDLLGVELVYTLSNGDIKVKRISNFSNSVKIEGFGDAKEYIIDVYSIDRGENRSEAVKVTISPVKPPVKLIEESIKMFADFGGVKYIWSNPTESPVALLLIAEDSTKTTWQVLDAVYTSTKAGEYSLRGQDTITRRFGIVVRDRWENYSDTITQEFKPLYEELIESDKFQQIQLPGDTWQNDFANMWNSNVGSISIGATDGLPMSYTIDLGQIVKLSRFKLWHYNWGVPYNYFLYYNFNYKNFNIYGSNDPNSDGSWDSWTLLKECETHKPSGLPAGRSDDSRYVTQEDIDFANSGFEFEMPIDAEPYRYLRIELISPWLIGNKNGAVGYSEIYGQKVK
ncbi:DUF5000 domain-containing lipoprotein [Sunxiuqinia rutila]|uniref:DUF5000 domain-containing lipoprotein n=1 Tax=Sunxiuqinia rutila TaxID=1397841 RepID=UPI003D361D07